MDLRNKTALVYDPSGDYTHVAEALVPEFGRVLFFSIWEKAFSVVKDYLPGIGLEGIERVKDAFDVLEDVDLVVFPDVGNYGLQEYLRRQGIPVAGCGAGGALEQDRWMLKRMCWSLGIEVADGSVITGIDQLRKILSLNSECYCKFSWFRGDMETRRHRNKLSSLNFLDKLSLSLGPYGQIAEFLIEEPIGDDEECVEVGIDTFCSDGQFPQTIGWGYEASKDGCYVGTIMTLPQRLRATLDKLTPVLSQYKYRGPFSTETRETGEHSYFLDFTARFGSPPSEAQSKNIRNLGEVLYGIATGEIVEPDYEFPYMVQLVLKSELFAQHPMAIEIDRPERTAIHGHCVIKGQDFAVSPSEIAECGGAVGLGNSFSAAMEECLEVAESIKGEQLTYDAGSLAKAVDCIRTGDDLGIEWGKVSMPSLTEKAA